MMQSSFEMCAIYMAETKFNLEEIIGFEALYNSAHKCKANVFWKDSVIRYIVNDLQETYKLTTQLYDGTYRAKPTKKFTITYPKKRDIVSIAFRDRVYQRSLNDNYLYPVMTKSFIKENFACQKGKGTDAAKYEFREQLRKFYRKYGTEGYLLKCDIKGYYPNMSHKVTEEIFKKKLDPHAFKMTKEILDRQYEGEVGYNPGSQLIQLVGVSMLDELDHFIKERLHIKYYVRYMDDFILIHQDKEYLERVCKPAIESKLSEKGLWLHPLKTEIRDITAPITFLGFVFRLTDTGKIVVSLTSENIKRERKKLRRVANLVAKGVMPVEKMDEMYRDWRANASGKKSKRKKNQKKIKPDTYKMLMRMDKYFYSLRREALNELYKTKGKYKTGHID